MELLHAWRGALRAIGATASLVAVLAVAGCGEDSAEPSGPTATQRVTRDFGRELLSSEDHASLEGHGTALRLLRQYEDVRTAFHGIVVASIDGLRMKDEEPDERAWVFNVNGIETDELAPKYRLYPGDVIQWDLRDWYITLDVRATVGAFPQTFTRGVFGKRFPVRVDCELPSSAPCRRVKAVLHDAGVKTDGSRPAGGRPRRNQPQRARILVGKWERWRRGERAAQIDAGARYSGVFARFSPDGKELRLLDWNAHRVRSEGAGTGLVAAMRPTEEDLLWVVTGVDDQGVERAADAFNARDLRDAFAVAVTERGVEKLPLKPR